MLEVVGAGCLPACPFGQMCCPCHNVPATNVICSAIPSAQPPAYSHLKGQEQQLPSADTALLHHSPALQTSSASSPRGQDPASLLPEPPAAVPSPSPALEKKDPAIYPTHSSGFLPAAIMEKSREKPIAKSFEPRAGHVRVVLQADCFLVVFFLPFSGKDKESRSRAGMREKPGCEGDSKRPVCHPRAVPCRKLLWAETGKISTVGLQTGVGWIGWERHE